MSLSKQLADAKDAFEQKLITEEEHQALRESALKNFSKVKEQETQGSTDNLTHFLERKDERERHTWKRSQETSREVMRRIVAAFESDKKFEVLSAQFRSKAEASLLGPMEAMLGSYALFSKDAEFGRFMLAYLLVHVPEKQRLQLHNWNVAEGLPSSWVLSNGEAIANLQLPLFPGIFEMLNEKVLAAGLSTLSGGGVGQGAANIFRPSTALWVVDAKAKKPEAKTRDVLLGGGYAVKVDENGMVHLNAVEDAFNRMCDRTTALERAVFETRSAPAPQPDSRAQAPPYYRRGRGSQGQRGRGLRGGLEQEQAADSPHLNLPAQ